MEQKLNFEADLGALPTGAESRSNKKNYFLFYLFWLTNLMNSTVSYKS